MKNDSHNQILTRIIAVLCLVLVAGAHAANTADNFSGGATASLLVNGNWSLSALPLVGNDAVFTSSSGGTGIRPLTAGTLTVGSFDVTATTGTFTINNQTTTSTSSTLTLGGSGDNGNGVSGTVADLLYVASGATFNINGPNGSTGSGVLNVALGQSGNFNAAGTMIISAAISGSGFGVSKTGSGTLTLSGANSYTGSTVLSAGVLKFGAVGILGNGVNNSSDLTLSGGTLDLAGFSPTAIVPLNLNSTVSTADVGSIENSTGSSTYGGAVSLGASTVVVGTTGTMLLFTNTVTGNSKGLKKDGTGTLELTNSGTVTLAALAANRGTIQVDSGTALNVTGINVGSGNSVGSGLTLNGGNVTSSGAASFGTATSGTASGTLQINSGSTLTVPSLNKGGSAGASVVFNANFNGGTLKANGNSATFFSGANNAKVQVGGVVFDDGGNTITMSQNLIEDSGSTGGGLTKQGTGSLTLSGANSYTGPTVINTGRLQFAKETSLYNNATAKWTAANLTVANGATAVFNVGGSGEFTSSDIDSLAALGTGSTGFKSGSTLGFDTSNGSFSYGTAITNPNSGANTRGLLKLGANTLTLSGPNSFGGALTLSGGALQLQNSTSLPAVAVTMASGTTLQLRADGNTTFSPSGCNFSGSGTVTYNFDVNNITSGSGNTLILANVGQLGPGSTTDTFNLTGGNGYILQMGGGSSGSGVMGVYNNTTINSSTAGVTLSIPGGISINFNSSYSLTLGGAGNLGLGPLVNSQTSGGQKNLTPTFGGSGTIALKGANNFGAAAGTVSSTGTLALNNNAALTGLSTLAINSAVTLDNTSGGTITISGTPAQTWSSDFTFGSANTTGALNLGTGTVTLGAARQVTVANSSYGLTVGGAIGGAYGLTKAGPGNLTLSGVSTFSGATTISGGTLTIGGSGQLGSGSYAGNIANSGTLVYNSSAAQTLSGQISGTGALTQQGAGTLTLAPSSGNNSYGGLTTVNGGKLVLQSSQTGTGNFTVADGADLTVTVSGTSQLQPAALTLGTTTGATLEFNSLNSTTAAPLNPGTLTSSGTLNIKVNSGTFTAGSTYPLISWTTAGSTLATTNLNSMLAIGIAAHLTTTVSGGTTTLNLVVDSVSDIWTGVGSGNWDVSATGNWTGHATIYADGDSVLFDDTATGTSNVAVNQVVQPGGLVVNNSAKTYTITSSTGKFIGGSTSLTKTGSGTLTLSGGVNTNTGVTSINGGIVSISTMVNGGVASDLGSSANSAANLTINGATLQYTGAATTSDRSFTVGTNGATLDASGTGALNMSNGGSVGLSGSGARSFTLIGTNTGANTLTAVIGDNGGTTSLTKSGTGSWTLSGANNYSGATMISAGTLALSGSGTLGNGSSALTVGGGTLDFGGLTSPAFGAVSITGTATIQDGSLTGTSYLDTHSSGTVSVTAALLGSAGLTASGGGTLGLSGTNAFTGIMVVSNGTVNLLNDQRGMTGGFWVSTNNSAAGTLNIGSTSQTAATLALVNSGNLVQVGNNTAGGTAYGIINVVGTSAFATTVTNNGSLWVGRQSQFNVNAYGNWVQNGDLMEQEQGGYWANFTVAANGSFTYAGVNPINLTVGGNVNDNLTIAGMFTTGQGFNFNNLGTGYPVIVLNSGGMLALSANIPLLITNTGTGTAGQLQLGTGGGVFNTAGFSTAIGLAIGNVSGQSGSLTKSGSGTLTLYGTNTYTGATTVSAGTLTIDTTGVVGGGASGSAITVNGGTLTENSTVATTGGIAGTSSLNVSSGTANLNTANNYSGATSVTGTLLAADPGAFKNSAMTLNNGATLQLRNNSANAFNSSGAVLDSGVPNANINIDVNNNGSGTANMLTLANGLSSTQPASGNTAATYTTTINITGGNGYLLALPAVTYTCGASYGSGGTRAYVAYFNPTTANLLLGNVSLNGTGSRIGLSLTLGGTSVGNLVTGAIASSAGQNRSVTKNGTGTWTLAGTNTYTGTTTISAGTLALSGSGSLASPTITVAGGAMFDISGLSAVLTLSNTQTLANSGLTTANLAGSLNTGSGTISLTFGAGTPSLNVTNGTLNLSSSTVFTVNNTGTALGAGNYKLVGALSGGTVAGTLPAVTVAGGGTTTPASLAVVGGELYLMVPYPTTLNLVSSPNLTNGYLDTVTFTATVQTNGATAASASGTVLFLVNGAAVNTNALNLGSTNFSLSTLPRGTNLIAAVYSGDANYLPSTNNLYQVVTNHPPVAGNPNYTRNQGIYSMRIPVANLLTNVTDADSDTIILVSTAVSSNGVTLLTVPVAGTNYLYYYSTNNVADQFDYTVADGFGGTNTGTVLMTLNSNPVFGQENVQLVSANGGVQLTFFGVPGNTYVVQRNLTLDSGNWQDLSTNSATTSNPVMVITDTNNPQAFYRLRWQSSP